ncbi:MAG: hypothetical protein V3575_06525 [Candidatus Absconditabacteria bacterium]
MNNLLINLLKDLRQYWQTCDSLIEIVRKTNNKYILDKILIIIKLQIKKIIDIKEQRKLMNQVLYIESIREKENLYEKEKEKELEELLEEMKNI